MGKIRQLRAGVNAWWQTLPSSDRRRCMLLSVMVPLAALAAFDARPRTVTFEALASGLTVSEVSAVRGHLEDRRVPYVVLDGGQTVMVPAAQRAELTVELNRLALLRGGLHAARGSTQFAIRTGDVRESLTRDADRPDRAQAHARGTSE